LKDQIEYDRTTRNGEWKKQERLRVPSRVTYCHVWPLMETLHSDRTFEEEKSKQMTQAKKTRLCRKAVENTKFFAAAELNRAFGSAVKKIKSPAVGMTVC
jgi:hypothetical protein